MKIPEELNMNNIRQSLVKERAPPFHQTKHRRCLTRKEVSHTIPEGLNVNNIRRSLVKERVPLPPSKTPKVFNLTKNATPQPEKGKPGRIVDWRNRENIRTKRRYIGISPIMHEVADKIYLHLNPDFNILVSNYGLCYVTKR